MFALLGSLHGHLAQYELDSDDYTVHSAFGGGLELLAFVGSRKKNFTLGGAISFVYVPKAQVSWRDEKIEDWRTPLMAISLGPAVDYRLGRTFHIGGLFGLGLERVPEYSPFPTDQKDLIAGFGAALWLGFDWKTDDHGTFGVLMTGHVRQEFARDIDAYHDRNSEVSLSLGLGVNVSRF